MRFRRGGTRTEYYTARYHSVYEYVDAMYLVTRIGSDRIIYIFVLRAGYSTGSTRAGPTDHATCTRPARCRDRSAVMGRSDPPRWGGRTTGHHRPAPGAAPDPDLSLSPTARRWSDLQYMSSSDSYR